MPTVTLPDPIVIDEDPEDTFTEDDWKELAATVQPGGGDAFTIDSASAALVGIIPARKRRSARNFFLGYSYADSADYALKRVNPVYHPHYPELVCTSARFQQRDHKAGPDADDGFWTKIDSRDVGPLNYQTDYHYATATLEFGQVPCEFAEDDSLTWSGLEYDRSCVIFAHTRPALEVLSAETDRYITFVEGPVNNPKNKKFPGSINEFLRKTTFSIVWRNVAEAFTHDYGLPRKIVEAIGTVNDAEFLGFPAGTLLLQEPEFRRYQQPVFTADRQGLYANDITLPFLHFDPPPSLGAPKYRGHLLFPWVHAGSTSGGGPGWYSAERTDGSPFLPESDFEDIFTHHGF